MKITRTEQARPQRTLKVGDLITGEEGEFMVIKNVIGGNYALLNLSKYVVGYNYSTLECLTEHSLSTHDIVIPSDKLELIIHD
jgi:hypothetical protein